MDPYQRLAQLRSGTRRAATLPGRHTEDNFSPGEHESLARKAGRAAVGGIGAVGNLLDIPGSMVRDAISGHNPFDQLMTPLSPDNRMDGRDVLEHYGILGKNKPGLDLGDVVGFVGEVALDPTTYLTGGASAMGKGGQLLSKIGKVDDIAKFATKQAGKRVGPRAARMTSNFDDVFDDLVKHSTKPSDLLKSAEAAAQGMGYESLAKAREAFGQETLGGLLGVHVPFKGTIGTVGKTGKSLKAARAMDAAGHAVRYSSPVRHVSALFDYKTKGATTEVGQKMAMDATKRAQDAVSSLQKEAAPVFHALKTSKILDPKHTGSRDAALENASKVTRYLEEVGDDWQNTGFEPDVVAQLDNAKQIVADLLKAEVEAGLPARPLKDFYARYYPREPNKFAMPTRHGGASAGKALSTSNPHYYGRSEDLKDLPYGTDVINEISMDPNISGFAHRKIHKTWNGQGWDYRLAQDGGEVATKGGGKLTRDHVEFLRRYLMDNYGPKIHNPGELNQRQMPGSLSIEDIEGSQVTNDSGAFTGTDARGATHPGQGARADIPWGGDNTPEEIANLADAHEKNIDKLVQRIAYLDPKHADDKVPFYKADPTSALDSRITHSGNSVAAAYGVYEFIGSKAVRKDGLQDLTKRKFSMPDSMRSATKGVSEKGWKDTFTTQVNTPQEGQTVLDALEMAGLSTEKAQEHAFNALGEEGVKHLADLKSQAWADMAGEVLNGADNKTLAKYPVKVKRGNASGKVVDVDASGKVVVKFGHGDEAVTSLHDLEELVPTKQPTIKDVLSEQYLPDEDAKDLSRYMKSFQQPEEVQKFLQVYDKMTNFFKSSVTSIFPQFHSRNLISGQFNNWLGEAYDPRKKLHNRYLQPVKDAWQLLRGKEVRGVEDIPWMKQVGLDRDPDAATRELQDLIYSFGLLGHGQGMANDLAGDAGSKMARRMPGIDPIFSKAPEGVSMAQQLNPLNSRGVLTDDNVSMLHRFGGDVGDFTEGLNRIAPFIAYLRQGIAPAEAARRVKKLQVDYSAMSKTESTVMKRLFPFYSFTRGILPFTAEQLTTKPGGRLGRTLMTIGSNQDSDEMMPDYVRETASLPLGKLPDGSNRYLTGLGLMFEDPLSFVGGPQSMGLEVLSRLNPMLKAPLEYTAGESFFQKGPNGGRDLDDLDPTLGRIGANISDLITGESTGQVRPAFGSKALEFGVANSPLSRATTTLRTLTDKRKWKNPLGAMLNLGTGARVSDISPAAQDAILRDRLAQMMMDAGGKKFERNYFSQDFKESLTPDKLREVEMLEAAMDRLAADAKKRKKQKQKATK